MDTKTYYPKAAGMGREIAYSRPIFPSGRTRASLLLDLEESRGVGIVFALCRAHALPPAAR